MATYKGIKGVKVVTTASDPTASEAEATVWYNSTGSALKYAIQGTAAWASGGNLSTGRSSAAGCGTQTAGLYFGGEPPNSSNTEKYNGTAWTEVGNLSQALYSAVGGGTQTAALCVSGTAPGGLTTKAEIWDGTSWADTGDNINVARTRGLGSTGGSTTAMLFAGGQVYPTIYGTTETYNGSTWTEVNNMTQVRFFSWGSGTSTAMLAVGGISSPSEPGSQLAKVESWNGTCWTEGTDLQTARGKNNSSGTQTLALCFGGTPGRSALTEYYDGTSWSEVADLSQTRAEATGFGTSTASLCAGDDSTPVDEKTEEWNDPVYTIKTVTVS